MADKDPNQEKINESSSCLGANSANSSAPPVEEATFDADDLAALSASGTSRGDQHVEGQVPGTLMGDDDASRPVQVEDNLEGMTLDS